MTNLHNCQFKLHICLLRYLNLIYNLQTPGENNFCFTFLVLRTNIRLAAGCKTHEGRIKMCHLRHSIQSNRYIRAGCKFTAPRQMNSTVHSGRRGQAKINPLTLFPPPIASFFFLKQKLYKSFRHSLPTVSIIR